MIKEITLTTLTVIFCISGATTASAKKIALTKEEVLNETVGKIVIDKKIGEYKFQKNEYTFADCKNNIPSVRGTWPSRISKNGKISGGKNKYTFFKDNGNYSYKDRFGSHPVKIVSREKFSCKE